ncbi:MAG: WG repeat-containing protein [Prevotella sp.]|nr:WG repeat-containing protein [Prevotella sp.]
MKNTNILNKQVLVILVTFVLPIYVIAQNYNTIKVQFEDIYDFSEGLALIKQNGKYGYIDKNGNIVIRPQFDEAYDFSDGLARIVSNGKHGYINKNGTIVINPQYDKIDDFSEGLALIKQKEKCGYIDKSGNVVIKPQFDEAYDFSDGLALIKQKKKYGYIDKSGKIVIKFQFDEAYDFSDGLALIKQNGKHSYIDKNGNIVIRPRFDEVYDFSDGLAKIVSNGKYGYINKNGNIVIEPQFDEVDDFSEGLALIKQNRKYGYIDKSGKIVIRPQYDEAYDFSDGVALIKQKKTQGYIDKNGQIIIQFITGEVAMTLEQYIQKNLTPLIPVSEYIKPRIEKDINTWQKKGEFESTNKWQERVNENTRTNKINELTDKYKAEYAVLLEEYKKKYKSTCEQYYALKEKEKRKYFNADQLKLSVYDADNESFMVSSDGDFADILLPVPVEDAPTFKQNWETIKKSADLKYVPDGDDVALVSVTFTNGGKKYTYDGNTSVKYAITDVDYNFRPIELALNNDNVEYSFDPLETIESNIVETTPQIGNNKANIERRRMSVGDMSDVDTDIPVSKQTNKSTFAVIIGNENYQKVSKVQFAQNDAAMFATYCQKTLGLPEKNIRQYKDATYATTLSAVKDIRDIAKAYNGDLNVIFYYAGHGIPSESSGDAFLLPVDADGRQTEVCYPLNRLYSELGSMGAHSVTVFMDACFSGSERGNNMLASARGVAIKAKAAAPSGKMIVFSAASGDETAYPYAEKGHGLFTYFLLKKLQETKGEVSLSELGSYIIDHVAKESIVTNGKSQTPTITPSQSVADTWQNMKLK